MGDTTAARKAYTDLLKKLKPSVLDAAPDDLLAQLDASHAEWHRQLGTDWAEVRGMVSEADHDIPKQEDVSSVHDNVRLIDKLMALLNERP